jgi:nitrogen regulatory protein PII-like uncharacterized protein
MVKIVGDVPTNFTVFTSILNNCVEKIDHVHERLHSVMWTVIKLLLSDL